MIIDKHMFRDPSFEQIQIAHGFDENDYINIVNVLAVFYLLALIVQLITQVMNDVLELMQNSKVIVVEHCC